MDHADPRNIPERPTQPPLPSRAQSIRDAEANERYADREREYRAEARRGAGIFWVDPGTKAWTGFEGIVSGYCLQNELDIPVMAAVRSAISGIGLTDAERWQIVAEALDEQIAEYARNRRENDWLEGR